MFNRTTSTKLLAPRRQDRKVFILSLLPWRPLRLRASCVVFLRDLRVLRGQNLLTTKSTKHTKLGSFLAPRRQERKEKYLLNSPNLAYFASSRESSFFRFCNPDCYFPFQIASRFSAKARGPSLLSSVVATRADRSASTRNASSRGSSLPT